MCYHSAIANNQRHYTYCVPRNDTVWDVSTKHIPYDRVDETKACSWKYLHSVDSMYINPSQFLSLYRIIERDFISSTVATLQDTFIVPKNPYANN